MRQVLSIWGFEIGAYGLCVGLAFAMAIGLIEARGVRSGFRRSTILDLTAAGIMGALGGMWLFDFRFGDGYMFVGGGKSYFGGLIGAFLVGLGYIYWQKLPMLRVCDCVFLYVPLCHAVGRIGCWLYGCCHGKVCPMWLPVGVCFPRYVDRTERLVGSCALLNHIDAGLLGKDAHFSLPVYPTQLFAAWSLVLVFLILRIAADRPWISARSGTVMFLYCLLDGMARWVEELFRINRVYLGAMTYEQFVSVGMVAIGALGMMWIWRRSDDLVIARDEVQVEQMKTPGRPA